MDDDSRVESFVAVSLDFRHGHAATGQKEEDSSCGSQANRSFEVREAKEA